MENGKIVKSWDRDAQKVVAEILRSEEAAAISPFDRLEADMTTEMSFDEFAATAATTYLDMQNVFTCIEYLRYMEGTKHLLFFTGDGLFFPKGRATYDEGLAAVANDARVAIDTFQTGGLYLAPAIPRSRFTSSGMNFPTPDPGRWVPDRTYALQTMRSLFPTHGRTDRHSGGHRQGAYPHQRNYTRSISAGVLPER